MIRILTLATACLFLGLTPAQADEKLDVVASFSILGDFATAVGGDNVRVTTLVGANSDSHSFEPSPGDSAALARADLIILNGLLFEPWADRLIEASGTSAKIVIATEGVTPIAASEEEAEEHKHDEAREHGRAEAYAEVHDHHHAHGEFDPHAFQDPSLARIYVANIAKAFAEADPAHASLYSANAAAYEAKLIALDLKLRAGFGALPEDRRTVVVPHNAFGYLGAAYGLTFLPAQGFSTEHGISAHGVAELIDQVRAEHVDVVFLENFGNPTLVEQIANETGAVVAGKLYSDALSGPDGPAPTYLALMETNAEALLSALNKAAAR